MIVDFINILHGLCIEERSNDNSLSINFHSCLALGTLIEHSPSNCGAILNDYLIKIIEIITNNPNTYTSLDNQYTIQNYFLSILASLLLQTTVKESICNHEEKISYIYKQIKIAFTTRNDVFVEGIAVISNLVQASLDNSRYFMKDFIELLHIGFNKKNEMSIVNACLLALIDIVQCMASNKSQDIIINFMKVGV